MLFFRSMEDFKKNARGWIATDNDYRLIFREDKQGFWTEITYNLPQFGGILLADYLDQMGISIPDDCQFCRIKSVDMLFEWRCYGGAVRIDVKIYEP